MRHWPGCGLLLALLAAALPSHAGDPDAAGRIDVLSAGILIHDRGPTSDRHENGIDPNIELQFHPPDWGWWRALGAPRPHLGLTPNLSGDTSALYAGVTYAFDPHPRLFAELALGLAAHDGPLHAQDRLACEQDSDCGFGSRVILRYGLELGLRLERGHAVTLIYDHMSHQELLDTENEGIDHIGLRYRLRY